MIIIQLERSMLNLDNKKPLLYWFCLLFDHSQVDIDYHQFILARWVLLLTVLLSRRSVALVIGFGRSSNSVLYLMRSVVSIAKKNVLAAKSFFSHMGSLGRFSNFVVFLCHPFSTCLDNNSGPKMTKHCCLEIMVWVQIVTKAVVPFVTTKSHLLWRIERSLHEEDPGHHHGEHFNLALFNSIKYSFN